MTSTNLPPHTAEPPAHEALFARHLAEKNAELDRGITRTPAAEAALIEKVYLDCGCHECDLNLLRLQASLAHLRALRREMASIKTFTKSMIAIVVLLMIALWIPLFFALI